ncbi:hypothetical protein [uncultured Negativibacillus sp.]|uniref:hypothetical protein n=1 Tax=uncultured Negativibacillus sp. TaxID=1980696 RepID=UPI0025FF010F|nr:hypothetical protein [uncultured Negativibacillus sp.]
MNLKNYNITVGEVLQNPQARALLQRELPMIMRHPMLPMANAIPLRDIINNAGGYVSQKKIQSILQQLERL